jgi:DNA-binding IclR family transcriptional regulator
MTTSPFESLVHPERVDRETGTRIQSVSRACKILLWLAQRRDGASAKEVAFGNQLALPTTYHILNTLTDQGLVHKNAQRRYILGDSTAILAQAYLQRPAVSESLLTAIRQLARRARETTYLGEWCEGNIRVVASIEGTQLLRVAEVASGPYEHAHARANGKVLLAYAPAGVRDAYLSRHPLDRLTGATICDRRGLDGELARIRRRGCAYDNESFAEGVSCIAAPVLDKGQLIGTLGISAPTERFRRNRRVLTEQVMQVAASISQCGMGPVA